MPKAGAAGLVAAAAVVPTPEEKAGAGGAVRGFGAVEAGVPITPGGCIVGLGAWPGLWRLVVGTAVGKKVVSLGESTAGRGLVIRSRAAAMRWAVLVSAGDFFGPLEAAGEGLPPFARADNAPPPTGGVDARGSWGGGRCTVLLLASFRGCRGSGWT